MIDGIYKITFRGSADWGMGLLLLKDGVVTGTDVGGVLYDGRYVDNKESLKLNLKLTVPPGVSLVTGTPPEINQYDFNFELNLDKEYLKNQQPVLLELPTGRINVIFSRLRPL